MWFWSDCMVTQWYGCAGCTCKVISVWSCSFSSLECLTHSPIAHRMAKTPLSFGHSECNRVKLDNVLSLLLINLWESDVKILKSQMEKKMHCVNKKYQKCIFVIYKKNIPNLYQKMLSEQPWRYLIDVSYLWLVLILEIHVQGPAKGFLWRQI